MGDEQDLHSDWQALIRRCEADPSIERRRIEGFAFPLGVYPVDETGTEAPPREGYTVAFEPADGDPMEGEWEEWPDRYVFDVLVSADRLEPMVRALLTILPMRLYPILDVLGHDAFREIDPYVAYDLVGQDRLLEGMARYRPFLFEDGLVGFGAISEEPFLYLFIDEHKVVTVRAESDLRERMEGVLAAFDLESREEIWGADAATHEHRGILLTPDDRPDLLSAEEIVEELRDQWRLTLNIDPETNIDDEGKDLGITAWRCVIRWTGGAAASEAPRYGEVLLTAGSLSEAEELALDASGLGPAPGPPPPPPPPPPAPASTSASPPASTPASTPDGADAAPADPSDEGPDGPEPVETVPDALVVSADRLTFDRLEQALEETGVRPDGRVASVWRTRLLE